VIVTWEEPSSCFPVKRWNSKMYYHPDTLILVGKATNFKGRNHTALDYAVMNSLQDAHMSVSALEKVPVMRRKKRTGEKSFECVQLTLFGD